MTGRRGKKNAASWIEQVQAHRLVALDSMVFIYMIEGNRLFERSVKPLFFMLEQGRMKAVTSIISLHESLIQPYQLSDERLANRFQKELLTFPGLRVVSVDAAIASEGARLRAEYSSLRAPDAFQLAAGIVHGATAFLTADRRLELVRELDVLVLKPTG